MDTVQELEEDGRSLGGMVRVTQPLLKLVAKRQPLLLNQNLEGVNAWSITDVCSLHVHCNNINLGIGTKEPLNNSILLVAILVHPD